MSKFERCLSHIDEMIVERHLLKHPFYQTWTAGELTQDALAGYAGQYYKHVEAFPLYLAGVYTHCKRVEDRRLVLRNLVEEDHGDDNHPELWLRFAEGLGLTREQTRNAAALAETDNALEAFRALCLEGSAAQGMAAIYAYEAMTPEVSETKIDGLQRFYGIEDERTLQFFRVHESADREHRQWDRALLESFIETDADADAAEAAASLALGALWRLLDGVHRAYVAC